MKGKNLMIGDWVIIDHPTIGKKAERIIHIEEDCIMTNDTYTTLDVEPVLLTGEILEKNGFVNGNLRVFATPFLRQRVWCKVEVYEYKPFRGGKQLNAYRLTIGGKESSGVDIHINYVHELQHAFRLCGIEKEIKL